MNTKTLGYAYPTSPIAKYMGYNHSGCWYLAVIEELKPIKETDIVYACESKEKAIGMVKQCLPIELEWDTYSFYKGE